MSTHLRRLRLVLLVVGVTFAAIGTGLASGSRTDPPEASPVRDQAQQARPHTVRDAYAAGRHPLAFAGDVVVALHGYDTRFERGEWRRELLATLGTPEGSLGARDVDRLIPDAAQWAQMAAVGQRASATDGSAYVPALWTQTVREHPELPDGAVGVTVTGTQSVSWVGGSSRVPVAVTVLLLCPPATEQCVVSRILAGVAR